MANGDVLIHNTQWLEAAQTGGGEMDFRPQLAGIRKRIAPADLAICHLETTLAPPAGPFGGYPVFATPPEIVDAIEATGYDGCSTVSNHTLDQGFAGVERTIDGMTAAELGHAGTARTRAESRKPMIYDVHGVKVAHLAYTSDFNGYSVPPDKPWCCNTLSAAKVIADAESARVSGARVVIVSMHAGDENVARPSARQRRIAQRLAASGTVDLVIGNHVHVVQPVEKIHGMWIAYGHGNLISGQYESWPRNREGVTTSFTFSRQGDGTYVITDAVGYPTFNAAHPTRVVDLVSALPRTGGDPRLLEAYRTTKRTLLSLGADRDGFVVPEPGGRG
ncbi:MAG: CapA family protein [Micrococcales bacterium]|nr:CapA family protein [Micrococcales bacterium]